MSIKKQQFTCVYRQACLCMLTIQRNHVTLSIVKNEELEHPTPRSLERVPYKGIQQSDDEPSGSREVRELHG